MMFLRWRWAWLALAVAMSLAARAQPAAIDVPAPELTGGPWLNARKPQTLKGQRGKVVILHFWTFGCINCRRNLPIYNRWQKRFAARKDLVMLSVHTPETDGERREENVKAALKKEGITYPVLVDGAAENWRRWGQKWWPTVYLLDRRGRVRYRWEGELAYQGAEGERLMAECVDELLAEGR